VALADHALSAVPAVLTVVLVARALEIPEFGGFALGCAVVSLALTLVRFAAGTRLAGIRDRATVRRVTGDLVAATLVPASSAVVAVLVTIAVLPGDPPLGVLLALALVTPVVCVQDVTRLGALACGRPDAALVAGGVVVAVMVLPVASGIRPTPVLSVILWGAATAVGLVVTLRACGARSRLRHGAGVLREPAARADPMVRGVLVAGLGTLWVLALASGVLGAASVGGLVGAAAAVAPVTVLVTGGPLVVAPELTHRRRLRDLPCCGAVALVLAGTALGWGTFLLTLPDGVWEAAFGASGQAVHDLLPWTVVVQFAVGVSASATLGLAARGRGRAITAQAVAYTAVAVVAGTAAAVLTRDPVAVTASLAGAAAASAAVGWVHLTGSPEGPRPGRVPSRSAEER